MVKKNSCVFISGYGSNLKSLIENSRDHSFPIKISLIICSNKTAKGIFYAKKNSYMTASRDESSCPSRASTQLTARTANANRLPPTPMHTTECSTPRELTPSFFTDTSIIREKAACGLDCGAVSVAERGQSTMCFGELTPPIGWRPSSLPCPSLE